FATLHRRFRGLPERQRNPGNADVAVHERLAGHPVAGREIGVREMVALLVLHRVGVLQPVLDPASAGAAHPPPALERNPTLLADREPQQVAVLGPGDHLVAVGDERDLDHRGSRFTRSISMSPKLTSCCSSRRAFSMLSNFGRNFDGTRLTTGAAASSTIRIFPSRKSLAITNSARLRPHNT